MMRQAEKYLPILLVTSGLITGSLVTIPSALAATCDPNSLQPVSYGQTSSAVTDAQACLIEVGYSIPAGATGYYGEQTKSAVIQFYASWYGPWDGMSIGPLGVQHLQSAVAAERTTTQPSPSQQPSGGTTAPTTNDILPSIPGVSSLILTTQDLSQRKIWWAYANLAQNSVYTISCVSGPACNGFSNGQSSMTLNTGSSTQGSGQGPFTPTAPGTYTFSISAAKGSDGSTPSAVIATLTIPGGQPQQQQQSGNPFGNVGSGLGCAGGGILPCFNIWTLTSITPQLPNCNFTATPSTIVPPQGTTLSWTCSNAESCTLDQGVGGVTAPSGAYSVTPAKTTTYDLTCSNPDGDNTFSTTVTVAKPFIKEVRP